jgi:SanA protein
MSRYLKWAAAVALIGGALVAGADIAVEHASAPYIYASAAAAPTTTVAMVLGASVYQNGTLSPILAARADKAAQLYLAGKVQKILVTGDNSLLSHNEVNPVGKYLENLGIPKSDIFLDHAGFDTYSSMYRAKEVFDVTNVTIVSQPFHLARAVYIARALGLNATGVEAAGNNEVYNSLREIPATLKALFDLYTHRVPEYLGTVYPISGDGSPTWADTTTSLTLHN